MLCDKANKNTINSLTKAIESFDYAFLAIKALDELAYKLVDSFFPHHKDYSVSGYPKDSFHIACGSLKTRLQNILCSPSIKSTTTAKGGGLDVDSKRVLIVVRDLH